jgi:3-deoxy-manno-octulosonate cytidylyltransferase (CMP-KDO synthetase)
VASPFAIILPARYESSRFPGKPLAEIGGTPLIEWVHRRAERVRGVQAVIIATDDARIERAVEEFGGRVVVTSSGFRTGTDRVAAVASDLDYDIIVNLQGDEPVVPDGLVEQMIEEIERTGADMVTPCHAITDRDDLENPNVVKMVMSSAGRALYFSRAPIPYGAWKQLHVGDAGGFQAYRHIGIYVYRKQSLLEFAAAPQSLLEKQEGLEQLRALDMGWDIRTVVSKERTAGVDVPEDIKIVEKILLKNYTG